MRTSIVRGITDGQALWREGRKRYRKILTLPTRASVMANAKCAADIMAKALNPFYGGRRKRLFP